MKKRPNQFSLNPFLIWFGLFGTIQKFDFGYFRNFICNYTITKFGTYITYPSRMVHYHGRSCYVLLLLCEHTTRWVIHILSYLFTFILFFVYWHIIFCLQVVVSIHFITVGIEGILVHVTKIAVSNWLSAEAPMWWWEIYILIS